MGNPSRRRPKAATARRRAASDEVAAPPMLRGPEFAGARAIWRRLAPVLTRVNVLAATDADAFARYCIHLDEWVELTRIIRRDGRTQTVKTTSGDEMIRLHPAIKARELAERRALDLEDRFGLNPRYRLAIFRDMSALNVPVGDLFGWRGGQDATDPPSPPNAPATPPDPTEGLDDDIIGFAGRPAGSGLPN